VDFISLPPLLITGLPSAEQPKEEKKNRRESSIDKANAGANKNAKPNSDGTSSKNQVTFNTQPSPGTPQAQSKPPDDNIEIQRRLADYNAQLAKYTKYLVFVGAGVGFFQVVLLFFQFCFTAKAANAAANAANIAGQTLYVSQRARVVVERLVLEDFRDKTKPPICIITIANHGGGKPAQVINCRIKCRNSPLPHKPDYGSADFLPINIPLPKGAPPHEIQGDFSRVGCDYNWNKDWSLHDLYIHGIVFYKDGFHEEEIRETGFCFKYDKPIPALTNELASFRIASIEGYNYMT
jgi:hypothetical protein